MYTGPNIIRDGLVFGYDTGYGISDNNTTTRHNLGEPTTNYLSAMTYQGHGSTMTTNEFPLPNVETYTSTVSNPDVDNNLGVRFSNTLGILTPGEYNISFSYYVHYHTNETISRLLGGYLRIPYTDATNTTVSFNSQIPDSRILSNQNRWIDVSFTFVVDGLKTQTGSGLFYCYADYATTGKVTVTRPMIELKDHRTPFTSISRSATDSLLDLTGNSTIDLSNMSFDSNAQMYFDGINNYINCGNSSNLNVTGHVTFEFIYKASESSDPTAIQRLITRSTSSGSYGKGYNIARYTSNRLLLTYNNVESRIYLYSNDMGLDFFSNYVHCIYIYNGLTHDWYINGVNESGSGSFIIDFVAGESSDNLEVGRFTSNRSDDTDGQIPITKIYNKALTAQEIKQNYNAYKSRFNL